LVTSGCRVADVAVRKACIHLITRLYSDDEARELSIELLKQETNKELIKYLEDLAVDHQLEGDEARKNAYLAPAEPVPARDLEIMASETDLPPRLALEEDDLAKPLTKDEDRHA
jgi:hypothetical protein